MTNNKQQTVVEWFSVRRDVLEIEVRLGKLSPIEYAEELTKAEQQAKEMDKELTIRFALFYAYGQDNVSEQLRTKIEKWYDKIYEGGEQ
jgi:hypothetical protein